MFLVWGVLNTLSAQEFGTYYVNFGPGISYVQDQLRIPGDEYRMRGFYAQYGFVRFNPNSRHPLINYAELQLGMADDTGLASGGFELAYNMGLEMHVQALPGFFITAAIGSGPAIVSARNRNQATGFIFSNNFEGGLKYHAPTGLALFLKTRYRHMSNLGFERPNGGLNNFILLGGIGVAVF